MLLTTYHPPLPAFYPRLIIQYSHTTLNFQHLDHMSVSMDPRGEGQSAQQRRLYVAILKRPRLVSTENR